MSTERGAESTYRRFARWVAAGANTERTAFFSDAVFAIAMTLLAVEIRVPEVDSSDLPRALLGQVPEFLAYGLSFAVIGGYWMTHHRFFKLLTGYTQSLQRLNLLVLLFVALIGYATGILVRYGDTAWGVAVYAIVISAVGIGQTVLWVYAHRRGLLTGELDGDLYRYVRARSLAVPVVFLVSIPVAFADADAAKYLWIAVLGVDIVLSAVYRRHRGVAGAA